jgi:hypothetical protein
MRHLQILFIALGSLVSGAAFSQSDSLSNKFEFSEFSLQFGNLNADFQPLNLKDAFQFAPQSAILNNLTGFQQRRYWYFYNPSFSIAAHMGFKLPKKKQHDLAPTLRIGLLFNRSDIFYNAYSKSNIISTDSLTNSNGAVTRYLQNVDEETVETRYSNDQLYLDMNLTYAINDKGRFSMFMGVGLGAGIMLNTNTSVTYSKVNSTREFSTISNYNTAYNFTQVDYREENYSNNAGFAALAYFPIGFDFRIGKQNEAWRKAHAFLELRPGAQLQIIPEANYTLLRSTVASQFGFRFDLR